MRLPLTLALALCLAGSALQPAGGARTGLDHSRPPASSASTTRNSIRPSGSKQLADADRVVLDSDAIAAQNARLRQLDKSIHDLEALQGTLDRAQVTRLDRGAVAPPAQAAVRRTRQAGRPRRRSTRWSTRSTSAPSPNARTRATAWSCIAPRCAPSRPRCACSPRDDDHDIDRFQESALFPGDPVVIAHESRDGQWWFVVSPRYAAWIEKRHVAEGSASRCSATAARRPIASSPARAPRPCSPRKSRRVSELQLDMGVRVPVLADWPAGKPVNGQHPLHRRT